jgi:hypothetical protein
LPARWSPRRSCRAGLAQLYFCQVRFLWRCARSFLRRLCLLILAFRRFFNEPIVMAVCGWKSSAGCAAHGPKRPPPRAELSASASTPRSVRYAALGVKLCVSLATRPCRLKKIRNPKPETNPNRWKLARGENGRTQARHGLRPPGAGAGADTDREGSPMAERWRRSRLLKCQRAGTRAKGPKSEIRSPKSEVQGPRSKAQSPKSKAQSLKGVLEHAGRYLSPNSAG